jgi:hypothetical protein
VGGWVGGWVALLNDQYQLAENAIAFRLAVPAISGIPPIFVRFSPKYSKAVQLGRWTSAVVARASCDWVAQPLGARCSKQVYELLHKLR